MTFNVNTDVNFAAYQAAIAPLDAYTKSEFDKFLIRDFANLTTAGTTLTNNIFATAIANALSTVKQGTYQF